MFSDLGMRLILDGFIYFKESFMKLFIMRKTLWSYVPHGLLLLLIRAGQAGLDLVLIRLLVCWLFIISLSTGKMKASQASAA